MYLFIIQNNMQIILILLYSSVVHPTSMSFYVSFLTKTNKSAIIIWPSYNKPLQIIVAVSETII